MLAESTPEPIGAGQWLKFYRDRPSIFCPMYSCTANPGGSSSYLVSWNISWSLVTNQSWPETEIQQPRIIIIYFLSHQKIRPKEVDEILDWKQKVKRCAFSRVHVLDIPKKMLSRGR
jgi:hypothetical protein